MRIRVAVVGLLAFVLLLTAQTNAQRPMESAVLDGQWMGISCSGTKPIGFNLGIDGLSGAMWAYAKSDGTVVKPREFNPINYAVEDKVLYGTVEFPFTDGTITFKLHQNDEKDALEGIFYTTDKNGARSNFEGVVFQPDTWSGDLKAFMETYSDVCKPR
jgi:hypothetical protein